MIMKRKLIVALAALMTCVAVCGAIITTTGTASEADLLTAQTEALTRNEFSDWWDSLVYNCESYEVWTFTCMRYADIPQGDWQIGGGYSPDDICCGLFKVYSTQCVSGSSVAHCWDC